MQLKKSLNETLGYKIEDYNWGWFNSIVDSISLSAYNELRSDTSFRQRGANNQRYADCADITFIIFTKALIKAGIDPNAIKFDGYGVNPPVSPDIDILKSLNGRDTLNTSTVRQYLTKNIKNDIFDCNAGDVLLFTPAPGTPTYASHAPMIMEVAPNKKWVKIVQGHLYEENFGLDQVTYPEIIYLFKDTNTSPGTENVNAFKYSKWLKKNWGGASVSFKGGNLSHD